MPRDDVAAVPGRHRASSSSLVACQALLELPHRQDPAERVPALALRYGRVHGATCPAAEEDET